MLWTAEGEAEDTSSENRQEEEAIFLGDTSFMQGAVGLTLMPPNLASRASSKDLAALACFVFGTDKSYGLFMSVGCLTPLAVCVDMLLVQHR